MDVDDNGTLDILTSANTEGSSVTSIQWFSGRGDGNFESGQLLTSADGQPLVQEDLVLGAWLADWDGDGALDLITGGREIRLYSGIPGGFDAPVTLALGKWSPSVLDWDGDGDLDLVTLARNVGVLLHENKGTRREPRLASPRVVNPNRFEPHDDYAATDWNADGIMDLLIPKTYTEQVAGTPDPLSAEETRQLEAAQRELERIQAAVQVINRERPRAFTEEVFAERQARRDILWRQAEAPKAIVEPLEAKRDAARSREVTRSVLELHLGK